MEITIFGKSILINRIHAVCIIAVLMIGAGILGFFLNKVYHPLKTPIVQEASADVQTKEADTSVKFVEEEKVPEIKVYVTGCVNKPGVVTIKKGQVIDDAIKIAGGATKEADLENINLAYPLTENSMLRVKARSASQNAVNAKAVSSGKTPANARHNANNTGTGQILKEPAINAGVDIITDSMKTVVGEESKTTDSSKSSLVNINKATQTELEELPNVGPSTAKAIIEYREKNGGFKKVTDIMKITGIKQKTFDKIKDYICVE